MAARNRIKDVIIATAWALVISMSILGVIELGAKFGELKCRVEHIRDARHD